MYNQITFQLVDLGLITGIFNEHYILYSVQ
jgi:hypothetical protein